MSGPWGPWGLHGLQGASGDPRGSQKAKLACYGARGTLVFVPNDYPGIALNDHYPYQFGRRGGESASKGFGNAKSQYQKGGVWTLGNEHYQTVLKLGLIGNGVFGKRRNTHAEIDTRNT